MLLRLKCTESNTVKVKNLKLGMAIRSQSGVVYKVVRIQPPELSTHGYYIVLADELGKEQFIIRQPWSELILA